MKKIVFLLAVYCCAANGLLAQPCSDDPPVVSFSPAGEFYLSVKQNGARAKRIVRLYLCDSLYNVLPDSGYPYREGLSYRWRGFGGQDVNFSTDTWDVKSGATAGDCRNIPPIAPNQYYRLRIIDTTTTGQVLDTYIRYFVPFDGVPGSTNADWRIDYEGGVYAITFNGRNITWPEKPNSPTALNWSLIDSVMVIKQVSENGALLSGSTVGRWSGSAFSSVATPAMIFTNSAIEVLRANESVINQRKHQVWDYEINNSLLLHDEFPLTKTKNEFVSLFNLSHQNVVITNELIDAPNASWSQIEFRDPWFVDTTDQYGKRNRGAVEARFWSRPSPFTPDATTLYNGEAYKGVFLNQGNPINLQPPYYTIRTQDNLSVGGSTARFLGWSASGANLVQEQGVSDTLRKAVVFQSPNAEVKAIYKGRLLSSNYRNSESSFRASLRPHTKQPRSTRR